MFGNWHPDTNWNSEKIHLIGTIAWIFDTPLTSYDSWTSVVLYDFYRTFWITALLGTTTNNLKTSYVKFYFWEITLITGPMTMGDFCFPSTLMFSSASPWGTLKIPWRQNSLFPLGSVVKCSVMHAKPWINCEVRFAEKINLVLWNITELKDLESATFHTPGVLILKTKKWHPLWNKSDAFMSNWYPYKACFVNKARLFWTFYW